MITEWIVGFDGSDDSRLALKWAEMMARETSTKVRPICAWHVSGVALSLFGDMGVDPEWTKAEAQRISAETLAAVHPSSDVDDLVVVEGHPSKMLLERSAADTPVVVGRRGVSALAHRLLGSVSQYLATHSDGPVVVVPTSWEPTSCQRIVVGFDGSDHSQAALQWAMDIAPEDATVTALAAIDVIPWLQPELVAERHPVEVATAKERILAAVDKIDPNKVVIRKVVLHGPRQSFASELGEADLFVVGPRGMGGIARAVLGSFTSWLLNSAACPVAVIPSA